MKSSCKGTLSVTWKGLTDCFNLLKKVQAEQMVNISCKT